MPPKDTRASRSPSPQSTGSCSEENDNVPLKDLDLAAASDADEGSDAFDDSDVKPFDLYGAPSAFLNADDGGDSTTRTGSAEPEGSDAAFLSRLLQEQRRRQSVKPLDSKDLGDAANRGGQQRRRSKASSTRKSSAAGAGDREEETTPFRDEESPALFDLDDLSGHGSPGSGGEGTDSADVSSGLSALVRHLSEERMRTVSAGGSSRARRKQSSGATPDDASQSSSAVGSPTIKLTAEAGSASRKALEESSSSSATAGDEAKKADVQSAVNLDTPSATKSGAKPRRKGSSVSFAIDKPDAIQADIDDESVWGENTKVADVSIIPGCITVSIERASGTSGMASFVPVSMLEKSPSSLAQLEKLSLRDYALATLNLDQASLILEASDLPVKVPTGFLERMRALAKAARRSALDENSSASKGSSGQRSTSKDSSHINLVPNADATVRLHKDASPSGKAEINAPVPLEHDVSAVVALREAQVLLQEAFAGMPEAVFSALSRVAVMHMTALGLLKRSKATVGSAADGDELKPMPPAQSPAGGSGRPKQNAQQKSTDSAAAGSEDDDSPLTTVPIAPSPPRTGKPSDAGRSASKAAAATETHDVDDQEKEKLASKATKDPESDSKTTDATK